MALPKCEYCDMTAQYDFVDSDGAWRYGCTGHWMKHRASRQLGPGHAKHLAIGSEPPRRPEGYVPPPVDPTKLIKPQSSPTLSEYVKTPAGGNGASTASNGTPRKPKEPREPKARPPREFHDMEPTGADIKEPRPGSVLALTLDTIKEKGGATLDEIQAVIGPKHDALKLLQWANENRGYGWKQDPNDKKIQVVYRG